MGRGHRRYGRSCCWDGIRTTEIALERRVEGHGVFSIY